jgi:hypothetical protein
MIGVGSLRMNHPPPTANQPRQVSPLSPILTGTTGTVEWPPCFETPPRTSDTTPDWPCRSLIGRVHRIIPRGSNTLKSERPKDWRRGPTCFRDEHTLETSSSQPAISRQTASCNLVCSIHSIIGISDASLFEPHRVQTLFWLVIRLGFRQRPTISRLKTASCRVHSKARGD